MLVGVAAPYKDSSDDYFAKVCGYALTTLFFFVTVLKVGVLTEQLDSVLTDELRYRFSFDAAFVSGGMLISIVGTLPIAAVLAAHRILKAGQIQEAARCSESGAAATGVQQSPENSARAETMQGSSRAKETRASLRSTRSVIREECPTQVRSCLPPSLPVPRDPDGALGTGAEAHLNPTRRLMGITHGEPSNAAVGPPAATPFQPCSEGELRTADVEEPPKDRKAHLMARRESMTAGDHLYKHAVGTKEGPGRLFRGNRLSSLCSASSSRESGDGASTPSSSNEKEVRV